MYKRFLLAIFLMFMVIGCDNKTTIEPTTLTTSITYHDITLENEYNDLTRDFDDLAYGEVLILPVDQIEGKVFVGWSDGENIYNNNLIVETSLDLEAIYENSSDVFTYYSNLDSDQISINGYTGISKYLRIPAEIDGYKVRAIAAEAFAGSDIVEVELPKTLARIYPSAFIDAPNLEKVSFYGSYSGTREGIIPSEQYDEMMEEFKKYTQIMKKCFYKEEFINEHNWN